MPRSGPVRHEWDLTPTDAVALQRTLTARVSCRVPRGFDLARPMTVAAADVSCPRGSKDIAAAAVALSWPDLVPMEVARVVARATFPYVPGLLSFREAPVVLDALDRLEVPFDFLLCDGQGRAHPRGLGLASHIGLWIDRPAVGCAKSRLCGESTGPAESKGSIAPLMLAGERVGSVVRTRNGVKPLYVSPGHLVDIDTSDSIVLDSCTSYRLPVPARVAHHAAGWRGRPADLLDELRRIAAR